MKKTVSTSFGLFAAALAGIGIWYAVTTRSSQAEADKFVSDSQAKKLVTVQFNVAAPSDTPADQIVFLSGSAASLGNWEAAGLPLEKKEDGKYHGSAEVMSGVEYQYKVTRGTWGTVETDAKGAEQADRTLLVPDTQSVDVAVASWRDGGKSIPSRVTMTGDVRLHKKFHSSVLNSNERTLIVYLPPDYEANTDARYPVLYMQDGQNLFDAATSYAGIEWRVDETAQQLIGTSAIKPVIIVGVYNGLKLRTPEFTPASMAAAGTDGKAELYGHFITDEVKPFIDRTYRTKPDKANTSLAGGSMGGLVALHIAKQAPQTFGQVALFSPWLRIGDKKLIESDLGDGAWAKGMRVYVEMGGAGGANYPGKDPIADGKELDKFLQTAGLKADADLKYLEVPALEHNEPAWAGRVEGMLTWLYGHAEATTQPVADASR